MPSRIIREGWLDSEAVNALDPGAELFFLRLCLRADDYGCYSANPVMLKSMLFPLRDATRSTDIPRWLAACEKAGLVRCYSDSATCKSCLVIPKFGQRVKNGTKRKFPIPPDFSGKIPAIPGTSGIFRPHSESEADSNCEGDSCGEPKPNGPASPPDPVFLEFPTVGDSKTWDLRESKLAEYRRSFPGLDVPSEMRGALQWARDNQTKRKTASGMTRFLNNWLTTAQNRPKNFLPGLGRGVRPPVNADAYATQ